MPPIHYRAGDWFAVPLRRGGYALGLIARTTDRGILLGYFFGPLRQHLPALSEVHLLKPLDALEIMRLSDTYLLKGKWPLLGRLETWTSAAWSVPGFLREDVISGTYRRVLYSDDLKEIGLVDGPRADLEHLPRDGLWGPGAVEIKLTSRLTARNETPTTEESSGDMGRGAL